MQFQGYSRQPEPGTPQVAVELNIGSLWISRFQRDSLGDADQVVRDRPINVAVQSAAGSAVLPGWEPVQ